MNFHASHAALAGSRLHAACACASVRKFSSSTTVRKYERSRPFVITHLALDLDVSLKEKAVSGTATLDIERRARSGEELHLDAVGFQLQGVTLRAGKGRAEQLKEGRDFHYDGDTIVVRLPRTLDKGQLQIRYRAVPRLGLYFLAPDKEVPHRPLQIWSQCQDEDGRHWFPCQDKPHVKMTYEMRARVPNGMSVLSGGELQEKSTPKSGVWEFHYRLDVPTPAYLITLVAGEFDEWQEDVELPSGKKIPLRFLVPQGSTADGKRAFQRTGEAIQLFSEKTGVDYPFARYTQVVVADFIFGGMENTTATTMYEHILVDKRASIDVEAYDLVAHELAHQWFGDLVTCRDWSHAWLNEGFATYFEHVEREHRLGLDEYEHNVTVDLNIYLGEARGDYQRPIVCRDYEEPIDLFDRHLYQKGGLVLHMLRRKLGDELFWEAIRKYLKAHQGSIVETNDLMRTLEEVSGLSLEKFFDQWVFRPGHPELKVKIGYADGALTVDVEQTQKGHNVPVFELPFEIEVEIDGVRTVHTRTIDERRSSIVVQTKTRPNMVVLDPRYLITGPISLTAPSDLLLHQLKNATEARGRRMAAMALGKRHDAETVDALVACLVDKKEAWMVRAKAAESLGKIRGDVAEAALLAATKIKDPKVRRAVTSALGVVRGKAAEKSLTSLTQDESYLVSAAAARALGNFPGEQTTKTLKNLLKKNSWSEVIRSGALAALAETGDEEGLPVLMEWSTYGKPLRARRAAIAALPRLGEGKKVRQHLVRILQDRDPHVRSAVLSALATLDDPKARGDINALLVSELDGGVRTRAREVLADLGKGGAAGIKEAKHENAKLKREVDDLKLRIIRLEQSLQPTDGKKKATVKKARSSGKASAKRTSAKKSSAKKTPSRRGK